MDIALIFVVCSWLIGVTIAFDILLIREKKKLKREYEKKLNDETVKILRQFYDEDGRRIEIEKEAEK